MHSLMKLNQSYPDLPKLTAFNDLLDFEDRREISEDVTDGHQYSGLCASPSDLFAVGFVNSHRLFEQQVIT